MTTDQELERQLEKSLVQRSRQAVISPDAEATVADRVRRVDRGRRHRVAGLTVVVAMLVMLAGSFALLGGHDRDQSQETITTSPDTTAPVSSGLPERPRIAVFGDSTALMTGWGLAKEIERSEDGVNIEGWTGLGCAVVRAPARRIADNLSTSDPRCLDWENEWGAAVDAGDPDIAFVQTGAWDIADIQIGEDPTWRSPGDPIFDEYLLSEMTAAVDVLSSRGALVVWVTSPIPGAVTPLEPGWDPASRMSRYNEVVEQLAEQRPESVVVVDLAGWIDSLPDAEDARLRPDGMHFTQTTSVEVCERFLCRAVLDAARGAS